MLFITHRLQAYFLKTTSGRWPLFTSMHCCKRVCKLPYTRLRRSSIDATSSTMAYLSSGIVTIRLRNTRSFRNPHRKKSGTVSLGDRAGQAMLPKLRTQVTRCCTLRLTMWNGVLSSTVPLPANHDKLSRLRNIQIWNVSVGSGPPYFYLLRLILCSVFSRLAHSFHICQLKASQTVPFLLHMPYRDHPIVWYTLPLCFKYYHFALFSHIFMLCSSSAHGDPYVFRSEGRSF